MIKIWSMVRTKADMIVNHSNHHYIDPLHINHHYIDHHHIGHHQGILYNILNLVNFSMRNCDFLTVNTMMIMKMKGLSMKGVRGYLILTQI